MSFDLNRIQIMGNVGADPKFSKDGKVLSFSVATNEGWTDKTSGELKKKATWHNVSVFGKQVNSAYEMVRKGTRIFVEGNLTTYEYEKNGIKMYGTSINCQKFYMCDGKPMGNEHSTAEATGNQQSEVAAQLYNPSGGKPSLPGLQDFKDDDIPF